MGYSDELWARHEPIWRAVHDHPFVSGIGDGSLPVERFRYYVEQDYVFLLEYSRVLALAVAKGGALPSMARFAELLHATLNVEMALHRGYAGRFGIAEDALARVVAAPTTYAYTRHLLATAYAGSLAEIFHLSARYEWAFWEMSWQMEQWPV